MKFIRNRYEFDAQSQTIKMKIKVNYIDLQNNLHTPTLSITLPAFLRHMAIAGQGERGGALMALWRGAGAFMFYGRYLEANLWGFSGIRRPDSYFNDPTDKGDFSTLAGRAVADFLAKRLLNAKFTHGYEAAMYMKKLPLVGKRPDFYCTTIGNKQFAMEAKGYDKKTISAVEMAKHKAQSQAGPLAVNFTVASVFYKLYDDPSCKFHDPLIEDTPFDIGLNSLLARQYYIDILEDLDNYLIRSSVILEGREFIAYDISTLLLVGRKRKACILVDAKILELQGSLEALAFESESIDSETVYVDVDGIGFLIT